MARISLDIAWRTTFTLASFVCFGAGALFLGGVVFPLVHLTSASRQSAQRLCRKLTHHSFRLFIGMMHVTGVLDYSIHGCGRVGKGQLIVANHPSLIDVIFIIAQIPDAYCVVKGELGRNLFTRLIVKATGYVRSEPPDQALARCVELLEAGASVVMFPEGTRSVGGQPLCFKRGAARVVCRARCPVLPVYLEIRPPTLAKGESWCRVPEQRVQYRMEIGEVLSPEQLLDEGCSERRNTRVCLQRLQSMFTKRLETPYDDERPVERHQAADSEYAGARGRRAVQHR